MLYDHQIELSEIAAPILAKYGLVYLAFDMRVGKTLTSLQACELIGAKRVLFLTTKKAVPDVESAFMGENFSFLLHVVNYDKLFEREYLPDKGESTGKKFKKIGKAEYRDCEPYDVVVLDEAHKLGALGRPTITIRTVKEVVRGSKVIFCSGTPSPETYSQLFHQFWVTSFSPFEEKNFFRWANKYIPLKQRMINGTLRRDYRFADQRLVEEKTKHLFISRTRAEVGFKSGEIQESILLVPMDQRIYKLADVLVANRYHKFLDGTELVCDSPVKLQSKLHQIFSGTIITETKDVKILDRSKARFIKEHFAGQKIAIFYQFQAEGRMLREELSNLTDSPSDFNIHKDKTFICQIQSGSMGINLASADAIVFMNINFSFVQYWQARARSENFERLEASKVFWVFAENGIEEKIFKAVTKKKTYTASYFLKDYGIRNTGSNPRLVKATEDLRREDGYRQQIRSA